MDLSVELPVPDADGRRRLFALYARGLETSGIDWEPYVARCEGVSPAYVRELLRQACLRAAEAGRPARLEPSDLDGAIDDLSFGGELAQRLLGAAPSESSSPPPAVMPHTAFPGFPMTGPGSSIIIHHDHGIRARRSVCAVSSRRRRARRAERIKANRRYRRLSPAVGATTMSTVKVGGNGSQS